MAWFDEAEAADADAPRPAAAAAEPLVAELGLFLRKLAPALPAADAEVDALCLRAAARLRLPRRLGFPTWMFSCGGCACAPPPPLWLEEFDDLPPPKDRERLPPPPAAAEVLGILACRCSARQTTGTPRLLL